MAAYDQPVLIAGGGIGGLSAALALAKHGISSRVFERRAEFSEAGAGIQLGPNATRLLTQLGVADNLKPFAAIPDGLTVYDGVRGGELTRLPLGTWMEGRHGAPYWSVHRQDLHASLVKTASTEPLIDIATAAEITGFDDQADQIEAIFASGKRAGGRALIAADGLWSQLRAQIVPGPSATPAGKCAYRGVIALEKLPKGLAANDVHIWLSPGAHVVHYPVRAGREIALIAVLDDPTRGDSWSLPAPHDWVAKRAGHYPDLLKALLLQVGEWRMWSLQKIARLPVWNNGRAAVLGDAAHPIFPFLAQGGVLAIEDACELAKCLALGTGKTGEQLAHYSSVRQPRAARVVDASARNGAIYHLSGPMAVARNAVLRSAPAARLMGGYDWLYGHRI